MIVLALVFALALPPAGLADDLYSEGEALLRQGRTEEAAGKFRQAVSTDPDHWPSHCRLGEVLVGMRQLEEAESSLRAAVGLNPASGPCLSRLAQVLLMTDRLGEAETVLVQVVEVDPGNESALFNLGRLYERSERFEEAIETFNRFLAVTRNQERIAPTHLRVARTLGVLNRPIDAFPHYRAILASEPGRHDIRAELATALMRASRYDESLAEFELVIAAGAADAEMFASAGSICILQQDMARAVDFLERSVAMDPASIPSRLSLANAQAKSNDHAGAVKTMEGVLRDDPMNMRGWFIISQSLRRLGRTEEAQRALEKHRNIHETLMLERMGSQEQGRD